MRRAYPDKRQAEQQGIAYQSLDNGFRSVDDEVALAGICNALSERDIERFWHRWEAMLPSPCSGHEQSGRTSPARGSTTPNSRTPPPRTSSDA
jgi:hypothetical protein